MQRKYFKVLDPRTLIKYLNSLHKLLGIMINKEKTQVNLKIRVKCILIQ